MRRFFYSVCVYLTVAILVCVALIPCESMVQISVPSGTEILSEDKPQESITDNTDAESEYSEIIGDGVYENSVFDDLDSENCGDTSDFQEEFSVLPEFSETIELHNSYPSELQTESVKELFFFSENIGSLDSANSVNTYVFELDSRCVFSYSVIHDKLDLGKGWKVTLYEEYFINGDNNDIGYRVINTLNTDSSVTKDDSVELGLLPGAYRLVVTASTGFTEELYKIEVSMKETGSYEVECNDNIYRYTELYSGVTLKGSASYFEYKQDEDWYLFRMYQDGFAELRFEHPTVKDKTSVCWQVIFCSESGEVLYSVNSLFTDELLKSGAIGLSKGNYYILVRNRVYTDVTYKLSVTRTEDIGFEIESNDTMDIANPLVPGTTVIGTISEKTERIDKDYFKFSVSERGYVVIEFAHEPVSDADEKNGWNFVLLDSSGGTIYSGISAWADDVITSQFIGLAPGDYYIRIDSENLYHNSERYYLSLNFFAEENWETEYNNTFDTADVMTEAIPVWGLLADMGTDYDFDFYTFTLDEAADISVIFSHEILSYSKDIFTFTLYDSTYNEISCFDAEDVGDTVIKVPSDCDSVTAAYKELQPGTYYIKVASGLFYDNIKYSLEFTSF